LFGSPSSAGRDNVLDVSSIEVSTIDRAVVGLWIPHICPVDVATCDVDHDAVGKFSSFVDDGFQIRAVGIRRKDVTCGQIQKVQTADSLGVDGLHCLGL
jgi:hypothetical protein